MGSSNPILVSICMVTYNHDKYIQQAIEGVLMQKAISSFELIISDDYSLDKTRSICKKYQSLYPEVIKLRLMEKNVGFMFNFIETLSLSRGKYIAVCEGDDYWTDPYKLQKQVSVLEEKEEYGLIYSRALIYDNYKQSYRRKKLGRPISKKGLLFWNPVPTLTTVFRKDLYDKFVFEVNPAQRNWRMADYPCWLWFYFNSKMFYLPEVTGVYRLLEESASHTQNKNKRYQYNLNSFDIADYFALKYADHQSNVDLIEFKNLYLYLYCIKNKIDAKYEHISKLKELKHLSLKTRIVIFILYHLKIESLVAMLF